MKVIFKSFLASTLIVSGIVASFPQVGQASSTPPEPDTSGAEEITEVEFEKQTDSEIIYTYSQYGKQFRAIETFNEDFTEVDSEIYELDKDFNNGEIVEDFVVEIEGENVITHDAITNEESTTDLYGAEVEVFEGENAEEIMMLASTTYWKQTSTTNGSSKPLKWTIGAIGITVAAITKVPATAKWVVNIANLTFQVSKDVVYYKYTNFTQIRNDNGRATGRLKTFNRVYSNSQRTNQLGVSTSIYQRERSATKSGMHHDFSF